jgi:signal peptidase I
MTHNRHAAQQASALTLERPNRKRWVALLLALVAPPIAMLYALRPLRAIAYLVVGVLMYPAAIMAGIAVRWDAGILVLVAALTWRVVAAVEAYRLTPTGSGERLPWYARAPALAAFLVAGWLSIAAFRSFVVQPFKIPSAAMHPTLQVGDYILVNKAVYGSSGPQRGDVAVFRFPQDRSLDFVMRVVGLPGDTVSYANRRLQINGRAVPLQEDGSEIVGGRTHTRYQERLGDMSHTVIVDLSVPPMGRPQDFPDRDHCRHDASGFACKVPAGRYLVMGDNRDNSNDSRYWGFVPKDHFVGRTFLIWRSARDPTRAGTSVR